MFFSLDKLDILINSYFPLHYKGNIIEVCDNNIMNHSHSYYFEKNGWNTIFIQHIPNVINYNELKRINYNNCYLSNIEEDILLKIYSINNEMYLNINELQKNIIMEILYITALM